MADGDGARPESERGRGSLGPEAVVRARGVVGKGVALKRGVQRGVGDGGAVDVRARFERPVGGAAEREKGRERRAVRPRECYVAWGCHGAWPRPAGDAQQWPERGALRRRAPRARCRPETERGGTDRWVAAQCQAAVLLTSGSGLSAGVGQSGARRRPAREETEVGRPDE
jgi:hypothetical protein